MPIKVIYKYNGRLPPRHYHEADLPQPEEDPCVTPFALAILNDRYLSKNETPYERFRTISDYYADNSLHAERMYRYIVNKWFCPATPVISNGATNRGYPISCFLNSVPDNMGGITAAWTENADLSAAGGGVGTCWSNVRSMHESVRNSSNSSGIIPFIHVMDSISMAVNQGSLRRGAAAAYLDISHPEIEEFIDLRKQTGDPARRSLNLHHGVTIPDKFMHAVLADEQWDLVGPYSGSVVKTLRARDLWEKLMLTRLSNQEPYIVWTDTANNNPIYKKLGLKVTQSNLCSEVLLATGPDPGDKINTRTAVCCLGSINLFHWAEAIEEPFFVEDCLSFLDNVLHDFICKTRHNPRYDNAHFSASRENSVGLGVMGFHSLLQSRRIPFASAEARQLNHDIFSKLNVHANAANEALANKKGACPDAIVAGFNRRFCNMLAIAPTANISIIAGGCSPCVEPWLNNVFTQKTLSGSFTVKNQQLEDLLTELKMNTQKVWDSILKNNGSVQHLNIPVWAREVYKTAFEIDQNAIIDMAGDRAQYIDQSQSINLFLPHDMNKSALSKLHIKAWKQGVKSLYYVRPSTPNKASFIEACGLTPDCEACQ